MTNRFPDKNLLLPVAVATLLGCTSLPLQEPEHAAERLANHGSPAARGPESCQAALAAPAPESGPALDPKRIELFVWNIQKGANPRSLTDLERLAGNKDLVLIQEARLEQQPVEVLGEISFWSFAPGYETASASTGVMTLSNTAPLTHCYLTDREPWLRSPKAVSITRFHLESTDQTLAVVNIHAVNFTFGVADFQRQIAKIESALESHSGPVILAGDFNTWRNGRLAVLKKITNRLHLHELSFDVDNRVTPFGSVIDRVFVRGLTKIDASTQIVDSSDHNPMSVTLRM